MDYNCNLEKIFKAYDIRGLYPKELDGEFAYKIGRSFVLYLKNNGIKTPKIVIGKDARKSTPAILKKLLSGIIDEGGFIVDIGFCSTPMFYFATSFLSVDGGIMITASHNPSKYNGFKIVGEKANPIGIDSGLSEIKKILIGLGNKIKSKKQNKKNYKKNNKILDVYAKFLFKNTGKIRRDIKLVIDAGNGMAGIVLAKIFKKLKINIKKLYFKPDCSFPNHEANPLRDDTLVSLKKEMKKTNADLGVAFDGDGDRVFFIDKNLKKAGADIVGAILSENFLKKNRGAKIVYDLRSSRIVPETILKNGGKPLLSRVGHSYIKKLMREKKAVFGAELSGHYYFYFDFGEKLSDRNYYGESAVFAMLKVLEIMSHKKIIFSDIIKKYQKYYQSGEINFKVKDKNKVMDLFEEKYKDTAKKIYKIDGLSVEHKNWRFNIRHSNTEPFLRLNLEADREAILKEKLREIRAIVDNF